MNLNSKKLDAADHERWRRLTEHQPTTSDHWNEIAEFIVETVGLLKVLQFGDVRLWRHAIAHLAQRPLPPLNLPPSIWDAYLNNPFASPTFHLAEGAIAVKSWDSVYYSWHSRQLALMNDNSVAGCSVSDVVEVASEMSTPSDSAILDRLQSIKVKKPFSPVCIRTINGQSYFVVESSRLAIDDLASVIAVGLPSGIELVRIADIKTIVSARELNALTDRLLTAQKTVPFRPFQLKLCGGGSCKVMKPESLVLSANRLIFTNNAEGDHSFEACREIGIELIEAIEFLPEE